MNFQYLARWSTMIDSKIGRSQSSIPTEADVIGSIVWNSEPASTEYVGWVYTNAGWKGFGVIA